MTELDLLGHLFYVALLAGQWLGGRARRRSGYAARVAGSLGWAAIGAYMDMSSIWIWSLAFAYVDARIWWTWNDRERWREPVEPG